MPSSLTPEQAKRIRRTGMACAGLVAGMIGLAYASVPLYDLFCRVTGFDGRPLASSRPASGTIERTLSVRFDANVAPGLNWRFSPETNETTTKVGQTQTVFYKVRNAGSAPTAGIATFNVQPAQAAAYFMKIECFCFNEQTLKPGETVDFPVVFYIDPEIDKDPNLRALKSITLSYTYFPAKNGAPVATSSAAVAKGNL